MLFVIIPFPSTELPHFMLPPGAGRMSAEQSAKQLRIAYDSVYNPEEVPVPNWSFVSYSQRKLQGTIPEQRPTKSPRKS